MHLHVVLPSHPALAWCYCDKCASALAVKAGVLGNQGARAVQGWMSITVRRLGLGRLMCQVKAGRVLTGHLRTRLLYRHASSSVKGSGCGVRSAGSGVNDVCRWQLAAWPQV